MALFKILKGTANNLWNRDSNQNLTVPIHEGYCYFTTDTNHMWIDVNNKERVCLNANIANKLGEQSIGNANTPIYLIEGIPVQGERLLPLSAGEDYKIEGPLGLTEKTMYDNVLPNEGFYGQLFFLEDNDYNIPLGGTKGQALIKSSDIDGDIEWNSSVISWTNGTTAGPKPKIFGIEGNEIPSATNNISGIVNTSSQTFAGIKTFKSSIIGQGHLYCQDTNITKGTAPSTTTGKAIIFTDKNAVSTTNRTGMIYNYITKENIAGTRIYTYQPVANSTEQCSLYIQYSQDGTKKAGTDAPFYGAVWNDYAEFRKCQEQFKPGQVVTENGDDTLSISTQRLQRGCSIISDTFGFAIGETDEAKCPIAVSGRVLAYPYESKEEFAKHIGWPVCAGPNGTVSIMTEEEEEKYPSRIIGTISAIPNYDTWGSGNIKVNNRIWIKIK